MPHKRRGEYKTRCDRMTLDMPEVEEYIVFRSTFKKDRSDNEKTQRQYAKNHGISEQALCKNYLSIEGIEQEITKRKINHLLEIAENGLKENAEGAIEVIDGPKGKTIIHKAPDTAACKAIYEIFGGFKPNGDVDRLLAEMAKSFK